MSDGVHGGKDGSDGGTAPAPHAPAEKHGFRDYARVLRTHRNFRYLWIAETVDNVGSWLSYVATLELASAFSGGSGLALSAVVLIRFLPSLLLAPVCGVVADRVNRVRVLVAAALADAVVVALLALVRGPSQVGLLYALLTLQFSAAAFYDPARKALVPVLVPAADLHLATTIDSFAWSITGAVGASAGGLVASRLGQQACFLVDAATFAVAAWCAWQLPRGLGEPDAAARQLKKRGSQRQVELPPLAERQAVGDDAAAAQQAQAWPEGAAGLPGSDDAGAPLAGGVTQPERRVHHPSAEEEGVALLDVQPEGAAPAQEERQQPGGRVTGPAALLAAAGGAAAEGLRALAEGWRYVRGREQRDVAALVLMKCCAALCWGAVDILNIKFSEMPAMQLGDASITLGLIFATVGLGCFVGPLAMNRLVAPRPSQLRWGVVASYFLFFLGLLVMGLSPGIALVLLSTFVRSMGSATLWVYSTLLLQQRVPNELLGRMSAIESALFTITETASSLFGGAAFDVLHLSLHQLLFILTAAAGAMAVGWAVYAAVANRSSSSSSPAYAPVPQDADASAV